MSKRSTAGDAAQVRSTLKAAIRDFRNPTRNLAAKIQAFGRIVHDRGLDHYWDWIQNLAQERFDDEMTLVAWLFDFGIRLESIETIQSNLSDLLQSEDHDRTAVFACFETVGKLLLEAPRFSDEAAFVEAMEHRFPVLEQPLVDSAGTTGEHSDEPAGEQAAGAAGQPAGGVAAGAGEQTLGNTSQDENTDSTPEKLQQTIKKKSGRGRTVEGLNADWLKWCDNRWDDKVSGVENVRRFLRGKAVSEAERKRLERSLMAARRYDLANHQ